MKVVADRRRSSMNEKIISREEKLLRRESYIRRERYVCLGLIVVCVCSVIAARITGESEDASEEFWGSTSSVIVCLLAYAYFCTLRLRHIASIKHHRGGESTRVV